MQGRDERFGREQTPPEPDKEKPMLGEANVADVRAFDWKGRPAHRSAEGRAEQRADMRSSAAARPVVSPERMSGHSLSNADDGSLIREAQRGNRAAFEELVRHYDQAVLRLALHLTGNEHEAQDIYQDAFLKAYRNIGSFRFECSFYTWIYRIVTNLCLDQLRKKQVRKEDSPVVVDSEGETYDLLEQVADVRSGANPERDLMRRELGSMISRALEKLTPRERMVFELKHYQGLKLRTIGEMLNTTEETAKNTLFRATQKLRGALGTMR
jgi:RNA polymerase sigma-70 factor (ECF subfamily)